MSDLTAMRAALDDAIHALSGGDLAGGLVAAHVARERLDALATPAGPEEPGLRPRPARRASPLDCKHDDWYRDTRDCTWCIDCGRWRDDVMLAALHREPPREAAEDCPYCARLGVLCGYHADLDGPMGSR